MHRRHLWMLAVTCIAILFGTAIGSAAEPEVMQLWPHGAPGETGKIGPERWMPDRGTKPVKRLTDVSDPTITVLRPAPAQANGCAIVICPGGGYNILAWDLEGTEIAKWLNSIGVTAIVLKYRVPRRDKKAPYKAPLQDAQRAIRLVRQHALPWKIDPNRIGILGFSAGGNLTVMAATHWNDKTYAPVDDADQLSCRPDFMVPIYPAYLFDESDSNRLSPLVAVNEKTPPAFIALTNDDKDRARYAALLYAELKRVGVKAELHVFLAGGHGYGMRPSENPVSSWPRLCTQWLQAMTLLDESP